MPECTAPRVAATRQETLNVSEGGWGNRQDASIPGGPKGGDGKDMGHTGDTMAPGRKSLRLRVFLFPESQGWALTRHI